MDTAYKNSFFLGSNLNSDGWSGCIYLAKKKNNGNSNIWHISFSEISHEKQVKQKSKSNPILGKAKPYVFGKINNLYTLEIGISKERLLLPAVVDDNLSVSIRWGGGISVAMLKPYYLKLIYTDVSSGKDSMYTEQHRYTPLVKDKFLDPNTILGSSRWSKSIPEITYIPGLFFETAIVITPGKAKSLIQVITLGASAAYYTQPLPIMADQQAYRWQARMFAGLALGKKW